jgi:mxaJ protein
MYLASSLIAAAVLTVCADPNNLPFSNMKQQGFENRIAALIARDLDRPLKYFWLPQRRGFIRNSLRAGRCDLVMGAPASSAQIRATHAYYRSSYAFVSRRDRHLHINSFDDQRLRAVTIGIQITGDDYNNPPAAQALASRRIVENVRGFPVYGDYTRPDPLRGVVDAVATGAVDVAVVWGPVAGFFAQRERVPLDVVPVGADADGPALPLVFDIAMGVRVGDEPLRAAVDRVIEHRRGEIRRILTAYGVPLR